MHASEACVYADYFATVSPVEPTKTPSNGCDQPSGSSAESEDTSCSSDAADAGEAGQKRKASGGQRQQGSKKKKSNGRQRIVSALAKPDARRSTNSIKWFADMLQPQTYDSKPHIVVENGEIKAGQKDVLYLWGIFATCTLPIKRKNMTSAVFCKTKRVDEDDVVHDSVSTFVEFIDSLHKDWDKFEEDDTEIDVILNERKCLVEIINGEEWNARIISCLDTLIMLINDDWKLYEDQFHNDFKCLTWPHMDLLWDVPDAYEEIKTDVLSPFKDNKRNAFVAYENTDDNSKKFNAVLNLFLDVTVEEKTCRMMLYDFVSKQMKKASKDFTNSCLRRRLRFLYRCIWHIAESSAAHQSQVNTLARWFFVEQHAKYDCKPICEYRFCSAGCRDDVPESVFIDFRNKLVTSAFQSLASN